MKVTAIIPTFNEENYIEEAINSVSFADEIIIIDSFSTDKTIEIAKSFKVNILQRVFDNFSSQKNYAISKAKHHWVFVLDADERVTPDLTKEISEIIKSDTNKVAYWIRRNTYFMGKRVRFSGMQNDKVIRLFKKEHCIYDGKLVHEEIKTDGEVGFLKNKLNHYSYKGFDNIIEKRNRYAALQAQALYFKNRRPTAFHFLIKPFYRFFKHYIIKFGFLDGYRGLFISLIYAYSVFVRYVKLWILRNEIIEKEEQSFSVDAVLTWVDGNDENHKKKMRPFYKGKNDWKNIKFRTRFNQVNEIEYAVKSIIKFAPYIQNIFIVSDEQSPSFLEKYNKTKKRNDPTIHIIDHKIIFADYLDVLPIFNSISIETLLYKIPNLAECFIYFNDDFLLINKTKVSDFFINKKPVIRGKWTTFDDKNIFKILYYKTLELLGYPPKKERFGYKSVQQNAAKLLHFEDQYFKIDHTPMPMRKSTILKFYENKNDLEYENIKYRFRNYTQHLVQSLATHLEIEKGACVLKEEYQLLFLKSYKRPLFWYKNKINNTLNNKIIFLCIQSIEKAPKEISDYIFNWLNERLK